MHSLSRLPVLSLCLLSLSVASCARSDSDETGAIVRVGNSVLKTSDLNSVMPGGMNSTDSIRFVNAYVNRWINRHLISDIAAEEIDMTDIDRLVDEYRLHLIELEYRKQMYQSHAAKEIPEDSLHNYYTRNNEQFHLERPMLRGVYLKVAEDAPNLNVIRRLYRSDKQTDIDRLEKEALTAAVHYDYFRDRWIDWEQIELHIPYDFGSDGATFLKGRDHFETTAGGYVYLLDINDVLPPGAVMPYDNAKNIIKERLTAESRRAYDAQLLQQLYDKSLEEGKIKRY